MIMQIVRIILGVLGFIAMIPSILIVPALIVTAIIGFTKKDFSYLKKCLKIWGYSLLALVGVMILYGVTSFIATTISGGA